MTSSSTRATATSSSSPTEPPSSSQHATNSSPPDGAALAAFDRQAQRWVITLPDRVPSPRAPLPEDDGKSALRRRIVSIQSRDVTAAEKALLMHSLLSEGYMQLQTARVTPRSTVHVAEAAAVVPRTVVERYGLAERFQSLKSWYPLGDHAGPLSLPLSEADRTPTFVPVPDPDEQEADDVGDSRVDEPVDGPRPFGCAHYRRNVKMQCATCGRWYTCRFCHDAVEDHALPRKETKNMLCMSCGTAQRVGDTCVSCGNPAGHYYCGTCKLWNDDRNKAIYHCPDCDICRVGQGLGKDFFHCHKCHACIDIQIAASHKCIERSTDCDCPICGEYMFSSTRQVVFMRCGHSIHRTCYVEHMRRSYRCPLCSRSCVNMETQFRHLDLAVQRQPMPPEYACARAVVSCNDCSAKSQVRFHWLGLKCGVCQSYNTIQLSLLHMPDEAAVRALVGASPHAAAVQPDPAVQAAETDAVLATVPTVLARPPSPASSPPTPSFAPSWLRNRLGPSRPVEAASPTSSTIPTPTPVVIIGSSGLSEEEDDEDEEDMVDFWGGDEVRNVTSDGTGQDPGSDEDDEDDDSDECEDDDDDDEEDEIQLLGHP